ncbi:MAG: ferritin-like domain-containing protein [Synergistaceae bacterium]|jgi:ferritin-like protein|nr:ferritin-like domain-containing protein [Synergistaceae bacterium]
MGFYIPYSELSERARSVDSAITSLMEELEAVNYYNQRADVAADETLKAVLIHNRNEEIEHAVMLFEWLRRNIEEFDEDMGTYLFKDAPITEIEETATGGGSASGAKSGASLGIGSLRK